MFFSHFNHFVNNKLKKCLWNDMRWKNKDIVHYDTVRIHTYIPYITISYITIGIIMLNGIECGNGQQ